VKRWTATAGTRALALAVIAGNAAVAAAPARAGEGGASFYLLGSGGPGAAELPPVAGIFFDNTVYFYSGKARGSRRFVVGGNVVAGLDATIVADFATLLWVPTTNFMGGTLAFGATLPVGQPDVEVEAVLTGPLGGTFDLRREDKATMIGDPVLSAEAGWKVGTDVHAALTATVNVPVGHYREGQLSNLSFHRWIVDTSAALTWKDRTAGWDVSGKAGLTFNGTNDFTDYDSGTDLHLEASVEKSFSKQFAAGLQAYHLHQLTGDSGSGATLGSNKGRVTGFGPTAAYSFTVGKTPVTARLRYFEEFWVKKRLDGRALFFSLDFPLKMNLPAGAGAHAD
jgi:hypothetical protein